MRSHSPSLVKSSTSMGAGAGSSHMGRTGSSPCGRCRLPRLSCGRSRRHARSGRWSSTARILASASSPNLAARRSTSSSAPWLSVPAPGASGRSALVTDTRRVRESARRATLITSEGGRKASNRNLVCSNSPPSSLRGRAKRTFREALSPPSAVKVQTISPAPSPRDASQDASSPANLRTGNRSALPSCTELARCTTEAKVSAGAMVS